MRYACRLNHEKAVPGTPLYAITAEAQYKTGADRSAIVKGQDLVKEVYRRVVVDWHVINITVPI